MNTTQETSVTSSQDRICTPVQVLKKDLKIIGETKAELEGLKSTAEELFPWITEFKKKCRSLLAQPNIVALIKLMKFYARNVSINVNECYTKPYRAAKLKDSISETLIFFLFCFRELLEVCDKNSYLDKMSDLLAMYLDMELKASRRGKEHHSKISARLTSCLYVYLENSAEHILDTFIKARFINRNYHDILEPVLTKVSKTITASPNCDTMYVRYLLIYRLWKKVNSDAAVKNQINATAILHLGSPPPNPTPFLAKYVLPKIPKSQANSTKFLLLHKFDVEKSCRMFVQYCKENREDEDHGDLDKPNFIANTSILDTSLETLGGSGMCRGTNNQKVVENLIDNANILPVDGERRQKNSVKTNNKNNGECLNGEESLKVAKSIGKHKTGETVTPLKSLRRSKSTPKSKSKKNGDILFIDLTEDEITEKVIKKKKQRKLHWLTEVKKKFNNKNVKAAADKEKKNQTIPHDSLNDSVLSSLVDSTFTRSLSTATTPERSTCLVDNFDIPKSLSTATTPEPDSCVTSNSAENELLPRDNKVTEFIEKQNNSDVTTTVTESTPISRSSDSQDVPNLNETINPSSDKAANQSPENFPIPQLSNALSHISELYDSDNNSAKENESLVIRMNETELLTEENIPVEHEEVLGNVEADENLEKIQRTSSESSEVAVIFTRRASEVEIVDLDEYTEVCAATEKIKVADPSSESDGVKNLTRQTDRSALTNLSESEETNKRESIETGNEKLEADDSGVEQKVLEKLETLKPKDYVAGNGCDYEPSKGDAQLLSCEAREEIVEKESLSIRGEYAGHETLIPKINEILNCTENDLITNEAPSSQFNDNIDGLSLLASVSQHVSHLEEFSEKSLSEPKIINSGHKNIAELKNQLFKFTKSQLVDDTRACQSPIKENNFYSDDVKIKDDKKIDLDDSSDVVPLILETTVDLNSSKLHNNLISVENVTQMIKESTNVIVNGETVVLFQKSPNSHLYIINKTVDGTMERLTEDKKTVKRNSTTMRDIINQISIGQDGVKNHHNKCNKTDSKKADNNSPKKYEREMILKQFGGDDRFRFGDRLADDFIKKEIKADFNDDSFLQRSTDTPGSVIELETVAKSPPPIIRLTDTPVDVKLFRDEYNRSTNVKTAATTGRSDDMDDKEEKNMCKRSIKQEFNNGNNLRNSDSQEVITTNKYNYSNSYPANTIPNVFNSFTNADNLYNVDNSKFSLPSSSLKVNSSHNYDPVSKSVKNGQSSCFDFTKEYVYSGLNGGGRFPAGLTNSYFSNDCSRKETIVVERELKLKKETAVAKLDDDRSPDYGGKSILDTRKDSELYESFREIKYKREFENKLPLKKRLKAHAMLSMNYDNQLPAPITKADPSISIKIENVNYPGTPMMSIAALETGNVSETCSNVYDDKCVAQLSDLELSQRLKDDSLSNHNREMIRRDYLKDTSLTSIGNCANVDDRIRKSEQQRRQTNSHVNIMSTGCQRSFKTPAQRKEVITTSSPSSTFVAAAAQCSLKRSSNSGAADCPKNSKKPKKTKVTGNNRQTRSSKRNIPKVDYSYDGIIDNDIKFNSLSELKRKRKKTSR